MADDEIVIQNKAIAVRNADGRFQRVATPSGFTDLAFRNAVAAADGAYRANGFRPSVDDCYLFWPKIKKEVYARLFLTDEFKTALQYRGVEWGENPGLTQEQGYALLKLLDPSDRRSTATKMKELGIPFAKYEAWMKQPLFSATYAKRAEAMFEASAPMAMIAFLSEVEARNMRAIELHFAMSGRYDPAARQVEDARTVVMKFIEALIRHETNPEIRKAIMADVALYAGSLQALEG
jgi:hypothetical protein